jgi:hypothetical protein
MGIPTTAFAANDSMMGRDIRRLFLIEPHQYGGHRLHYNFAVLWVTCSGIGALYCLWRRRNLHLPTGWMLAGASASCSLPVIYLLYAHLFDSVTGVRYSCPLILAILPVISLITANMIPRYAPTTASTTLTPPARRVGRVLQLAGNLAVIALFFGATTARTLTAVNARTLLAYPVGQAHLDYQRTVLRGPVANYIRSLQARTKPGEPILVWAEIAFAMDFKRNVILTASENTLINPMLRFPVGARLEDLQTYLRGLGIRYVLFQSEGYSILSVPELQAWKSKEVHPLYRKIIDCSLYAKRALGTLAERNRVLYQNEYTVLYELAPGSATQNPPALSRPITATPLPPSGLAGGVSAQTKE